MTDRKNNVDGDYGKGKKKEKGMTDKEFGDKMRQIFFDQEEELGLIEDCDSMDGFEPEEEVEKKFQEKDKTCYCEYCASITVSKRKACRTCGNIDVVDC